MVALPCPRRAAPRGRVALLALLAAVPGMAGAWAGESGSSEGFLLQFHAPPGPHDLEALAAAGLHVVHAYAAIPAVYAEGPWAAAAVAARLPAVVRVELDRPIVFHLARTTAEVGARAGRTPGALEAFGISGEGVAIAVVDTGLDATHSDLPLGTKVLQNVKLVQPVVGGPLDDVAMADTDLASGHGTHVAGIAAGTGGASEGALRGVAPGASLVGVGIGEAGRMWIAAAGLDWVWRNAEAYGIRVATNSWGPMGGSVYDPAGAVERLIAALHARNVTVVFSVGNDGLAPTGAAAWDEDHLSGLAMSPYAIGVTSYDGWSLALADTASRGDPARSTLDAKDGSQRRPDLAAPGEGVASTAALLAGPLVPAVPRVPGASDYTTLSGTSMAAPHVAGAAALVLEAIDRQGCPATPDAVAAALYATARRGVLRDGLGGATGAFDAGRGALDAYAAVQRVLAAPGCDIAAAPAPPPWPSDGPPVRAELHVHPAGTVDPWAGTGGRPLLTPGMAVQVAARWSTGLAPDRDVGPSTTGFVTLQRLGEAAPSATFAIQHGSPEPWGLGADLRTANVTLPLGLVAGTYELRAWLDAGGGAWAPRPLRVQIAAS